MNDFEKIYSFKNLYKAHKKSRLGKRNKTEVINFEINLSKNLVELSNDIKNKTYKLEGYYTFKVYDPKVRDIFALHYKDRVVQHCICDEVLCPIIEKKLIYDNAACRIEKGTRFALNRLKIFLRKYYNLYCESICEGYFLKCDIKKYFDNIDHNVLKNKLDKIISDSNVKDLLFYIIDSYEKEKGKGLPLGNQTSQWFAIYYLDGFDRLIKEKLHIKYYVRYMDDMVIVHKDKEYLKFCLKIMKRFLNDELLLEFNKKTQIFPIKNGVDFLGFHIFLNNTGKIIVKLRNQAKIRIKNELKKLKYEYENNIKELPKITESIRSIRTHISYGNTYKWWSKCLDKFVLTKK